MVIGLINQAVYLCDKKSKEGGIMKKETGRWNNHGYKPQSKLWKQFVISLWGIILSAVRDCSTYKFQYTSFLKSESHNKISISIIIFVLIFIGVTNMSEAGLLGIGNTASWKEEVLLHDGSKIIVERWQKRGGSHDPGQEPGIKEQSITFTLPGTKHFIKWQDEYNEELGRCNFILVALHIMNNIPYIIAKPRSCLSYNKWGRPNPPYVIFKFESNKWKRIELTMLPLEFKNINLVITTIGDEDKLVSRGLVSAEMVKELNSDLTQEEYKTIARTLLKGVGCPVLVRIKDGWESPGGAKAPLPISPSTSKDKK
jgi:hypothetical protein